MTGEPNLAGQSILVLEDDYMQASDMEQALTSVGAQVVGPFSKESCALEANGIACISAAIIDINLGCGPSFETAHALNTARVPFLFLTGYDQTAIPAEFESIPRFVKPMEPKQIVKEVARMLGNARPRD